MTLPAIGLTAHVYRASSSEHGGWKVHDNLYMVVHRNDDGTKAIVYFGKRDDVLAHPGMKNLGVTERSLSLCDEYGSTEDLVGWDDEVVLITDQWAIRRAAIISFYLSVCRSSNRVTINGLYSISSDEMSDLPYISSLERSPIFGGVTHASIEVGARAVMGESISLKDARVQQEIGNFASYIQLISRKNGNPLDFGNTYRFLIAENDYSQFTGKQVFAAGAILAAKYRAGMNMKSASKTFDVLPHANLLGWSAVVAHMLSREPRRFFDDIVDNPEVIAETYAWVAESMTWCDAMFMFTAWNQYSIRSEYDWIHPHFSRCERAGYSKYSVLLMLRAGLRYKFIQECVENGIEPDLAIEISRSMDLDEAAI